MSVIFISSEILSMRDTFLLDKIDVNCLHFHDFTVVDYFDERNLFNMPLGVLQFTSTHNAHVLHLRILNVKDSTDYWFKVKGLGLWYLMPLSTIFQNLYIVVISFIGGGNQSTWRKPLTCRKSLTNFYHIMLYRVHLI